jgi:hypothetical protein
MHKIGWSFVGRGFLGKPEEGDLITYHPIIHPSTPLRVPPVHCLMTIFELLLDLLGRTLMSVSSHQPFRRIAWTCNTGIGSFLD